ncbi:MAG: rod shape-determining protein MreC [Planctomycetaceae bacterium]
MRRGRITEGQRLRGPIACCVLAILLLSLGPSGEAFVRSAVRDASRPGFALQRIAASLVATLDLNRWPWTAGDLARQQSKSPSATTTPSTDREVRRLRAELAAARRELAAYERSLGPMRRSAAATVAVERIPARILHAVDEQTAAGGVLLGSGTSSGITAGQLAVEPDLLTVGTNAGTPDGGLVLAGAAVVGRTDDVGAWTSTLLPISNSEFRAHVSLVRESTTGPVVGDDGILEGDDRGGCIVRYVPSTASVSVGDHVYSFDPSGRLPQPLYYGRVEQAELRRGAPHWDIRVRPAADVAAFAAVHVLIPAEHEPPRPVTMTD